MTREEIEQSPVDTDWEIADHSLRHFLSNAGDLWMLAYGLGSRTAYSAFELAASEQVKRTEAA